ncbi:hypothetical protein [Desulfovibrio sp. UCD-KL4C]|uniref:hypothetical protein n=1 Tax=Desulfovibrio sp. UCD-KL4C TaxID=2578120 RepID=UPI0025BE5A37|nr:hypothetical protein [Desulfovibrio sp. UCD-KL4C]
MITFVLFFTLVLSSSVVFASKNYGVIKFHDLKFVVGNSVHSKKYDYVLLFDLKNRDPFRAMKEIERSISSSGDVLCNIATLDKVIVVTVKSHAPAKVLFSRYARTSHRAPLCRVYTRNGWKHDRTAKDVFLGHIKISVLTKKHSLVATHIKHEKVKVRKKIEKHKKVEVRKKIEKHKKVEVHKKKEKHKKTVKYKEKVEPSRKLKKHARHKKE